TEQPHDHRDGNHRRQHDGQAGDKIGAPAGEMVSLLHDRTLVAPVRLLKETEAARVTICGLRAGEEPAFARWLKENCRASNRSRRFSSRFITLRPAGVKSS